MANEILGLCSFEAKKLLTQFKNAIRHYDKTEVLTDEWEQAMTDYKDIYLKIITFIGDLEKQLEQSKPRIDLGNGLSATVIQERHYDMSDTDLPSFLNGNQDSNHD